MIELGEFYEVVISPDKMEASIIQQSKLPDDEHPTVEELKQFINEKGITFGIDEKAVEKVVKLSSKQQQVIATGKPPEHGSHAYLDLVAYSSVDPSLMEPESDRVDLKDILYIPTIRAGDKIAVKVAATEGVDGTNVLGQKVAAKPGRDFTLRKGKNTRLDEKNQTLYSLVDGQISMDKYTVHVLPTYEVNDDISMKTGNISFVGNVTVRGGVPAGFEVKAGGDIRIGGTVEGAKLEAGGSIYIGAGVVGQNRSFISAAGDLETTFINQGHVEVGGDIIVKQTILHSTCSAAGSIICLTGKGTIVGGSLSALKSIQAKEIGNSMQTKTSLFIGVHEKILQQQQKTERELEKAQDEFTKLAKLLKNYLEKERVNGPLTGKDKLSKLKALHAFQTVKQSIELLTEKQQELLSEAQSKDGFIQAENVIHPNVDVHFGKYKRNLMSIYRYPYISLVDSEIVITTK
ncbi:FapA family protein [Alkalihalobacillus oceani]|uniref:DUF342 domain-containing protein n=1 Tax=Halalkalibacter oceani TaxID=1653776 RepID=UPI00203E02BC|nr:FapA family protein [Halalkalibacter oceani]MCM3759473.1 FapA family protein [Halalkalibacter oceani]